MLIAYPSYRSYNCGSRNCNRWSQSRQTDSECRGQFSPSVGHSVPARVAHHYSPTARTSNSKLSQTAVRNFKCRQRRHLLTLARMQLCQRNKCLKYCGRRQHCRSPSHTYSSQDWLNMSFHTTWQQMHLSAIHARLVNNDDVQSSRSSVSK